MIASGLIEASSVKGEMLWGGYERTGGDGARPDDIGLVPILRALGTAPL